MDVHTPIKILLGRTFFCLKQNSMHLIMFRRNLMIKLLCWLCLQLVLIFAFLAAAVVAEPPVGNGYLPPSQTQVGFPSGNGRPSSQYGVPSGSGGAYRNGGSLNGGFSSPSSRYGVPSGNGGGFGSGGRPSSQYGAPTGQFGGGNGYSGNGGNGYSGNGGNGYSGNGGNGYSGRGNGYSGNGNGYSGNGGYGGNGYNGMSDDQSVRFRITLKYFKYVINFFTIKTIN